MNQTSKVSIIIPVYKPDLSVFKKVKAMIKKQTIESEIIEMWNNPEAVSMNKGIKKANGRIVVTLAQDCVPHDKYWLEKLVKPLENKNVIGSVSDLYVPKEYWKNYPFLTKILTINERTIRRPTMDARACAFRKKDIIMIGMFNENPKTIAIDGDLKERLEKKGEIIHPNVIVDHLHPLDNSRKLKLDFRYAEANGKLLKAKMVKKEIWKRLLRATPLFGMLPIIYVFPWRKFRECWFWFFPYLFSMPLQNIIYFIGFWKGFLLDKESMRNKEVLNEKKD